MLKEEDLTEISISLTKTSTMKGELLSRPVIKNQRKVQKKLETNNPQQRRNSETNEKFKK